ncbi:uncharacterized protein LOC17878385 [Capsella rubella]|uniref:uncharacterized protein LOC17878385 n=1 Tax=Capsella rubella TaxID=81985 RepID=UPI000CD4C3DC|nr:uncharacterized protein LOC17878385 [Capsella rubella]
MPNKSPQYANDRCHFSKSHLHSPFARCTICNINISMLRMGNQPPPTIYQPKHHEHTLTLLLRLVTFTCNACGVEDCIEDLPRVICINRHDHRISHTFHLGQGEGEWECGVCRKRIDWVYGAFKCSRCPSYAVHSRCATRKEVWDFIELEGVPEEEEEVEEPYRVINEKEIVHFSHEEHVLRLDENNVNLRCQGCVLPINGDPCYKCVECDFGLHKACASLPRKKRRLLHNHKLVLQVDDSSGFWCKACRTISNGFRYKCVDDCDDDVVYDVRCSSASEPFQHDLHPHPLYWTLERSKRCQACNVETKDNILSCTVCDDYALCMGCATLPRKVKHRCDDHFLSLCQGVGNASGGNLWCDICETKTDPNVCYYTCEACGLSLHLKCVLGDFYYMKVGGTEPNPVIFANNGVTRPFCIACEARCKFPVILWAAISDLSAGYICSSDCAYRLEDKY